MMKLRAAAIAIMVIAVMNIPAYAEELDGDVMVNSPFPTDIFDILPPSLFTPSPILPDAAVIAESINEFGMRFYVFQTADGHTYFLVISGSNVYLLNTVTDKDLTSLIQANAPEPSVNTPYEGNTAAPPPAENKPANTDSTKDTEGAANTDKPGAKINPTYITLGILMLVFTAFAVYIKIIRPKKKTKPAAALHEPYNAEDDEEDAYDSFVPGDEPDVDDDDRHEEDPPQAENGEPDEEPLFTDDEDEFS